MKDDSMIRIKNAVLVQTDAYDIYSEYPTLTLKKMDALPPLGLCYIAAVLEREGCEVVIIDNYVECLSNQRLAEKIIHMRPDFLGFSVNAVNVFSVGPVSKLVKSILPDVKIICGGPHATIVPDDFFNMPEVDYLVIGEGEITVAELVRFLRNGGTRPEGVPGIMFRNDDGKLIFSGQRDLIENLDQLPFPARRYLDLSKYRDNGVTMKKQGVVSLSSSRGCPFQCAFCSSSPYWDKRFRARSAANVVDEVELMVNDFGARGICFREDIFTLNKKRLNDFCDEMKRRGLDHIPWECETRVDTVDLKQLEKMRASGCHGTWVGVESGSPKILKQIFKRITVEQVKAFFKNCKTLGIDAGAGFMLGFPDETREDVKMSLELGKKINPTWAWYQIYVGYPDSPLYQYAIREGLTRRRWGTIVEIVPRHFTPEEALILERDVNTEIREYLKKTRPAGFNFPVIAPMFYRIKPSLQKILGDKNWRRIDNLALGIKAYLSRFRRKLKWHV